MKITYIFILMLIITVLLLMISFYLPDTTPDTEKYSPYECGFDPTGTARLPFSIRFFLIAILFLLFDLEIALLLPTPWAISSHAPQTALIWIIVIIALLTAGLTYEWLKGGLEWAE